MLLLLIVLGTVAVVLVFGVPTLEEVRSWVAQFGWAGPAVYIAIYAAISLTPAAPASVLSITSGLLFGFAAGLPCALAGAFAGALLGFGLARALGRESMSRFLQRSGPAATRLAAVDRMMRRRGLLAVVGIRLAPVLPFSVLNMACGLSGVRFRDYAIGSALGMTPGATALVAVGAFGLELGSLPSLLAIGGLLLVVVIGRFLAFRRGRADAVSGSTEDVVTVTPSEEASS